MTTEEFSNEFDSLFISYLRFRKFDDRQNMDSINIDEYEKSLFLTNAQEDIVLGLYNGALNGVSFEETEELRRHLSDLVNSVKLTTATAPGIEKISTISSFFTLPSDVWFIIYESIIPTDSSLGCKNGIEIPVTPVSHDDYYRSKENPFKWPGKRHAYRLDLKDNKVEILSKYTIGTYFLRYLAKPGPIVLTNLDSLSVNGVSVKTECMLNSAIHRLILERAVQMAIQKYGLVPKSE